MKYIYPLVIFKGVGMSVLYALGFVLCVYALCLVVKKINAILKEKSNH